MALMRDPAVTQAEFHVLEMVREHDGQLTPVQVIDTIRHRFNVRDDVARAALWFLINHHAIVITRDWRTATP